MRRRNGVVIISLLWTAPKSWTVVTDSTARFSGDRYAAGAVRFEGLNAISADGTSIVVPLKAVAGEHRR